MYVLRLNKWFYFVILFGCLGLFLGNCMVKKDNFEIVVDRPRVDFKIPSDRMKKVVLENGMTVLVFEQKHFPKVVLQVAYDVGSGTEVSGERGLAHLIEHMIFKGTNDLSEGDIDAISLKYGAKLNAFTGKDETAYFFEVDKNNWEPFVDILADCMKNARFKEQHLASEMKAVIQELRMCEDSYIRFLVDKAFKNLYPSNHPYHDPIIGYKEDLLSLSADGLRKFYRKNYDPSKAVLFVVGDVNADEIINVAKERFGKIPGNKEPVVDDRIIPHDGANVAVQVDRIYRDVKNSVLAFYWKIPGRKAKNTVLTSVVEGVLGEGEGSIFYRRLVDDEKLAISSAAYAYQLKESGIFFVVVEPREGCIDKCRAVIAEEMAKIIENGVEKDAFTKVVRKRESQFFTGLQNNMEFVRDWMNSFLATRDENEIFRRVDDFYKTDKESVKNFVQKFLDPFLMNELQLLPIPEEKKYLWIEKKKLSDEMDAKILARFERTEGLEGAKKVVADPKPIQFSFPKPDKTVELDNGLKVVMHRSAHFPLVTVHCKFKETDFLSNSKEGSAIELMMNCLVEGSRFYGKKENVDFFDLYGANYWFEVSGTGFSSVNVGYKNLFERWFHILTSPAFDKAAFEKVKNIAIDYLQRAKDNNIAVARNLMRGIVYKNHPYGYSFDDAIEYLKKMSLDDLKLLHKKYVCPKNMVMFVVGDFDLDQMERSIQETCGEWASGSYQEPNLSSGEFIPGTVLNHEMLRDQMVLILGQASPVTMSSPDRLPLRLINTIAFRVGGSRLWDLRERTGLFYTANGGWAYGLTKVHGFDYIFSLVSLDKVGFAEQKIRELVDTVGMHGVTQKELNDSKTDYLNGIIDFTSSISRLAMAFAFIEEYRFQPDYFDTLLKRVQDISLEEINQVAKKYFDSKKLSKVRVGRVSQLPAPALSPADEKGDSRIAG